MTARSRLGWNVEATEDGFGLAVKGRLMVDTELGRYAQSFLKTGLGRREAGSVDRVHCSAGPIT
jgi:hypothetical protein